MARADALAPLIADKLAELQQTIELRRTRDFAAAQAVVLTDRGKKAMDAIRTIIQEMNAEEESAAEDACGRRAKPTRAMRS